VGKDADPTFLQAKEARAPAEFATSYADQNDKDHAALHTAVDDGAIPAVEGI
jgi:hypothetical protein